MAIDAIMRGLLEQYIDSIVIAIPNIVKVFFDPSKKARLQIQNDNDFALGVGLRKYTKCIFNNLRFYRYQ